MKSKRLKYLAAILLLAGVQQAQAVGTLQGTNVGNTATVVSTAASAGVVVNDGIVLTVADEPIAVSVQNKIFVEITP